MNGLFGINGLFGFLVAVVLVVVLAICFGVAAATSQSENATNYYIIKDSGNIEAQSADNKDHFEDAK